MPWNPLSPGSTSQADNQGSPSSPSLIATSAARTATGNSGAQVSPAGDLGLLVDVTAVSGTTPSMTLSVEWSNDGTAWATGDPADTFTALTAAARRAKAVPTKAAFYRVVWTITGTTPSFTFSIAARG